MISDSSKQLTLVAYIAAVGLPTYCAQALAQPAPVSYTDRIITEVRIQPVEAATEAAVIESYRDASEKMGWKIPADLEVTSVQPFFVPEGTGTQVHVSSHNLGKDGVLFIATNSPEVFQRMTDEDLANYGRKTAFFPAGTLTIAVLHPTSSPQPKVVLERIRILNRERTKIFPLPVPRSLDDIRRMPAISTLDPNEGLISSDIESLCGPDDRTRSTDKRLGRLMPVGCTGWLIGNDLALTAGHCSVGENMDILEFQVPSSTADGQTNPASPNDQYPVIKSSIVQEYKSIGDDWAVFQLGKNSNTGKLPGEQQGDVFKLSKDARPRRVHVTGYGVDDTPPATGGARNQDSQTQQTEGGGSGATVTYYPATSQAGSYFRYQVDTTGGNSGSPVLDSTRGGNVAVAIHTNGGCEAGGNHGTALDNADLRDAIRRFVGDLAKVYIDESESRQPTLASGDPLDYRKMLKPSK